MSAPPEGAVKIVGKFLPVSIEPLLLYSIPGIIQSCLCLFGIITFMLFFMFLLPFWKKNIVIIKFYAINFCPWYPNRNETPEEETSPMP